MKFEVAITNHWPDMGSKGSMRLTPPDEDRPWRLREVKDVVCTETRSEMSGTAYGGSKSTSVMRTIQLIAIWELAIPEPEDYQ
jgi:hypothetical protein